MATTAPPQPSAPARTAAPSYVHGASSTPLLGISIGDFFVEAARTHRDGEALVSRHQGKRFSYAELLDEVDRVARGLIAFGFAKGDRVGIWAPNRWEWVVMQFAT